MRKIIMIVIVVSLLGIVWPRHQHSQAQDAGTITTENADRVLLLDILGRGRLLELKWHGDHIYALSTRGLWKLAADIDAPLPADPFLPSPAADYFSALDVDAGTIALATGTTLQLYDLDGALRNETPLMGTSPLGRSPAHLDIVRDGKAVVVVAGGRDDDVRNTTIHVYDLATLEATFSTTIPAAEFYEAEASDDVIAVHTRSTGGVAADDHLRIYDINNGDVLQAFNTQEHAAMFAFLSLHGFSNDGRTLFLGTESNLLQRMDVGSGELTTVLERPDANAIVIFEAVYLENSGNYAFVETNFRDIEGWWAVADDEGVVASEGRFAGGYFDHIAQNDAGSHVVFGGYDGNLGIYALASGDLWTMPTHFVAGTDQLRVVGESIYSVGFAGGMREWSEAGVVRSWWSEVGSERILAWDVNQLYLAAVGQFRARVFDLQQAPSTVAPGEVQGWNQSPYSLNRDRDPFASTGRFAVHVAANGDVRIAETSTDGLLLWDSSSGETPVQTSLAEVRQLFYSPFTGNLAVLDGPVGARDIHIYDGATPVTTLPPVTEGLVVIVNFSPDDATLLMMRAGIDCQFFELELATGALLLQTPASGVDCRRAAQSPTDPRLVATLNFDQLILHDVSTGEVLHSIDVGNDTTAALAFSADGTQLYTGTFDGYIAVWGVPAE